MVSFYGDYDTAETVVIPFNAFTSNDPSASVTVTNLASTDVYIYKDGSLTQRTSFAGIAVDIDVDGIVGNHWVTVDLSNNTDAGFYVAGSRYQVRMEGVTIDGATVNAWIGAFSIGCTLRPTTAGRKLTVSANGEGNADVTFVAGNADRATDLAEIARYLIANDADPITDYVNDDSLWAKMLAADGDISAYDDQVHSQEAIAVTLAANSGVLYSPDASSVITTGTEDSGTFASTAIDDATWWTIGDSNGTNTIEVVCEFNMGTGRQAAELDVVGYFNRNGGGGYVVQVDAWNYTTGAYVTISGGTTNTELRDRASDKDYVFALASDFTDAVTTPGEVKIRFRSTRGTTQGGDVLYLNYVAIHGLASAALSPEAVASAVWLHDDGEALARHTTKFTGKVWYVDAAASDDEGSGQQPDDAYQKIGTAISGASAGDFIKVKAGSYAEAGIDLSKSGLELHGEIGAILTGGGGVPLTISTNYCRTDEITLTPAAGQIGLVVTSDFNKAENIKIVGGLTAVQDTGTGNEINHISAEEYTATGFDLQGDEAHVLKCQAVSSQASTRGYYLSNTGADRTVVEDSISVNNDTAGFEVVSGVTNATFVSCTESPTCGTRVDAGTSTAWRNHSRTDHQTDIADILVDTAVIGFGPAYAGPRGPGVYLNDAAANTNTVKGTDGTWDNAVSTISAAKTIADSLGVKRIYLINNSTVTLAAAMEDWEVVGIGEMSVNTVNFGTQDVDNSAFHNLLLTGAQGGTGRCQAESCCLSSITGMEITALGCLIADGGSLTLRNDCAFDACFSAVAGSGTPTLNINSVANVNVYFRHYSGGLKVTNAVATTVMSYESDGQLVVDATCTSLTVVVRGNCSITNNGTTTSLTRDAAITRSGVVDEWETQSQADPTGFHVNVREWLSQACVAVGVNGVPVVDVTHIHGSALTETSAGYLAAAFVKLFDVATPLLVASDVMRGTDSAALASVCTEARLAALTDWINGGRLDVLLDAIKTVTDLMSPSAGTIVTGTVDTVTNSHTPTTTEFQADDVTEATADHFNGRIVIFTSGALVNQATDITDYVAVGGIGQFTVTALTEAPANNDTFVII